MFFKTKQQMTIFIAAGVMVAGFVFFVYLPLDKKLKAVKAETAMARVVIEEANSRKEQLPVLEEQFQQMQSLAEKYELSMPEQRELGSFLHQIADLMHEHNLKNQFIEPDKEVETEKLNCIPVSMKCRGKLVEIFEFYKSLQNLNRLIRIEHVSLENKSDAGSDIDMETEAVIYYRPTKEKG
jgi:type IV pilus assembly protein PilO